MSSLWPPLESTKIDKLVSKNGSFVFNGRSYKCLLKIFGTPDIPKFFTALKNEGLWTPEESGCIYSLDGSVTPYTGEYKLSNGVFVYITDISKSGFYHVWFENEVALKCILKAVKPVLKPVVKQANSVYEYSRAQHRWVRTGQADVITEDLFIGYRHYLTSCITEIDLWQKHQQILQIIGENHSRNFLLHGPPGVGKTTMIKAISTYFGAPIYYSQFLVDPDIENGNTAIVVWEDFDRTIAENIIDMSALLNTLDGVASKKNIVRFFTANSVEVIKRNAALFSRMSTIFEFYQPSREIYEEKMISLLSALKIKDGDYGNSEESRSAMVELAWKKALSLRTFSQIIVKHVFKGTMFSSILEDLHSKESENQGQ